MGFMKKYEGIVLTREQVRSCDRIAIERLGISGLVLMENAGVRASWFAFSMLDDDLAGRVVILCGTGNNGGDGFVVARQLLNENVDVDVLVLGPREKIGGDALSNLVVLENMGFEVTYAAGSDDGAGKILAERLTGAGLIVDAMLGTGTSGAAREPFRTAIEMVNEREEGVQVLALDIPSGLDCDSGETLGAAVRADLTVTFAAMKKGFLVDGAEEYTGEVAVASIGVEPEMLLEEV